MLLKSGLKHLTSGLRTADKHLGKKASYMSCSCNGPGDLAVPVKRGGLMERVSVFNWTAVPGSC